jgi:cysteine desulfurase
LSKLKHINFDYAAGYPTDPDVIKSMTPYFFEKYGNPSSLYFLGEQAREAIIISQKRIGELIGNESPEREIFFTSGATESNNLALKGYSFRNKRKGNHIIISSIEHISIINIAKYLEKNGFIITYIPVDQYGQVNISKIKESITDKTILVSIIFANNEIGTIQPISEIGKITTKNKISFHVDATVSAGKIPIDVVENNIDMLTLSSNDIYGPKGVGGLFVRLGTIIEPIIQGGGQQNGLRSGSENIPGIVGFGKAAELSKKRIAEDSKYMNQLRDNLESRVINEIEDSYVHGHPTQRLPDLTLIRIFGVEGEAVVTELERENIYISTGSACAAKTLSPSHVLEAIGLNEIQRHGALQFSFSRLNRKDDVDKLLSILPATIKRLRDISPVWKYKDRFLDMYSSKEYNNEHISGEDFKQF